MRWVALALMFALLCGCKFEGYSPTPYADPVGHSTVCYGHKVIHAGQEYTQQRCAAYLVADAAKSIAAVYRCAQPATAGQFIAFADLAYNVGQSAFCRSSVARLSRQNRLFESCRATKGYVYAKGRKLSGLVKRRIYFYHICLDYTWPA